MGADIQIGRMNRDVLRRQALLDDARHLVFGDGGERGVVAVEKREAYVFIAYEERGTSRLRVAFAEAEEAFVGALAGNDLLKAETEILALVAFYVQLPLFAALLTDFQHQLGLAARVKAEVQVVAHHSTIDSNDAVARLKLKLCGQATGRNLCNLDS